MAHLMGQGKLAVQSAGIVEKNIGVDPCAGGVGPGAFSWIGVDVDPALVVAFAQDGLVRTTQRGQGGEDGLLGLLERDLTRGVGDQRGIDVVHMQFIQSQQAAAQVHVTVQLVQVLIHRSD